jgi:hypothetical protein
VTPTLTREDAEDARRYWAAGRCPCCGACDFDNYPDHQPVIIGEGVRLCAWCEHRGCDRDDVAPLLLRALLEGASRAPEEPC